jgi:hypothetical protein
VDEVDGGSGVVDLRTEQQVVSGTDGARDLGGGTEFRRLSGQGLVFAGFGADLVDGLEATAQPQNAFAASGRGVLDTGDAGFGLAPVLEGDTVTVGHLGEGGSAGGVEEVTLLGGALEAQLFGLAVEGDEVRGDVGEHGDRHCPSARSGPGATFQRDGAGDDRFVVGAAAGFFDAFAHGFGDTGEDAFDFGLLRALADDSGADLAAHEQGQCGDEHRLSRTGLTGDDSEAGVEFDGGLGDDTEVGDAQ